jgi:hypothetical protein
LRIGFRRLLRTTNGELRKLRKLMRLIHWLGRLLAVNVREARRSEGHLGQAIAIRRQILDGAGRMAIIDSDEACHRAIDIGRR